MGKSLIFQKQNCYHMFRFGAFGLYKKGMSVLAGGKGRYNEKIQYNY